jgi:pilus assembly protein CpaC
LQGTLYRRTDYLRILDLIEQNKSTLYLSLTVEPALATLLQQDIAQRLRLKGLTPLKVQFGKPWRVFYSKAKIKTEIENSFRNLGLKLEFSAQATDVADNIKVAVKIVEITKNFEHKLGVRWPDSYQAQIIDPFMLKWADSFDLAINAAEKEGEAKILASPNLICRSGKEADFFAGGEFPIKVIGLRSKEIQWKRYGIGLKLKPLIDPVGQMSLHIETEVSTLDRSITVDDMPALHTNRVSSFFDLISSRTIAISGLIKSEVSENSEGLPLLKNIPILGRLFASKNFQENKSELVIFVTPELMN